MMACCEGFSGGALKAEPAESHSLWAFLQSVAPLWVSLTVCPRLLSDHPSSNTTWVLTRCWRSSERRGNLTTTLPRGWLQPGMALSLPLFEVSKELFASPIDLAVPPALPQLHGLRADLALPVGPGGLQPLSLLPALLTQPQPGQ